MRLRLKISRHRLPDIHLVWAATEQEHGQKKTIASLLSDVNASVPLESVAWALDDYIVEVGGFECLHYNGISDVLQEGDEVTIRALSTPDIKQRRLGGRSQITADGFHLLDGVPFGLGPTQRPPRPGILIPARKRRLAELDEGGGGGGGGGGGADRESHQLTIADVEEDEIELAEVNSGENNAGSLSGASLANERRPSKKHKSGNVTFKLVDHIPGFELEDEDEDEDEDDEEDGDFADSSSLETSEAESVDSNVHSEQDDDGGDSSSSADDSSAVSVSEDESEKEEDTQASSATDSQRSKDQKRGPDERVDLDHSIVEPSATNADKTELHNLGKTTLTNGTAGNDNQNQNQNQNKTTQDRDGRRTKTQLRNQRRRDAGKLGHLKRLGYLPQDATIKAYYKWNLDNPTGIPKTNQLHPGQNQHLLNVVSSAKNKSSLEAVEVSKLIKDDAISVEHVDDQDDDDDDDDEAPDVESTAETRVTPLPQLAPVSKDINSLGTTSVSSKQARIDLNSSRRVIFGALGQRTPKTAADAERVKARLASFGIAKKKPAAETKEALAVEEEEDEYSQNWRNKITLTAVECTDLTQELSEPPYPFVQRWDPSQQTKRGRSSWGRRGKARKKSQRNAYGQNDANWQKEDAGYEYGYEYEYDDDYYDEPDENYNGDEADAEGGYQDTGGIGETTVFLDYDEDQSVHADRQHLIESGQAPPDLPELPEDPSSLATLTREALVIGIIIAFKRLECDERTGWQPVMSPYRTAQVLSVDDKGEAELVLANRDCPRTTKKYDRLGRRIFEKFETIVDDDEEQGEEDGIIFVEFADMVEAKIVGAAAV